MSSSSNLLNNLGDALSQQFLTGSNHLTSIDIAQNGTYQKFGQLGTFANEVDQTADRSYVQEGFFKLNSNPQPKQREIVLQDPELTVLVKKRQFASLAENFRSDFMDLHDQLFIRATKVLFQNKCKQIAAYEALSKISLVSTQIGEVDAQLLPVIFGLTDVLNTLQVPGLDAFNDIIDQVREVVAFNQDFQRTTWHTKIQDIFSSSFGEGTGVMELTNVMRASTTTSIHFAEGRFSLEFSDPYRLMKITNDDIERAIADTTNKFYNNVFLQLGSIADQTLNLQKQQLNQERLNRGANNINFIVDPNTFLGKRVRAIIDLIGYEIQFDASSIGDITGGNKIDPSALQGSAALTAQGIGDQGLSPEEVNLFNNIVSAIYNQLSLQDNSRRRANYNDQDQASGQSLNKLRQKLRLHYGNKLIIQPMDNVSIFINSKKKYDDKIIGGLQSAFSGLGFLQSTGNLLQNIKDNLNVLSGYSVEKSAFVGDDFPNWLWLAMRNKFVSGKEGICVFSGVVEDAQGSYRDGAYEVSVSGGDNAKYFSYGIVNLKPSIDVYNGPLYDPLTPFDLQFDSVSGVAKNALQKTPPTLLPENQQLFNSVFLRTKNGLSAGVQATAEDYLNPDNDIYSSNSTRQSYYDPDGMVYRWKEGIATLVLFGDSYDPNTASQGQAITKDPFAGQDIMNVLSLLITGEPYNYTTFYKSAIQTDSLRRDPVTNQVSATSYYRGLRADLKNRNAIYGDFIPFKLLTVDEASFEKMINGQLTVTGFNQQLQNYLEERANLADQIKFFSNDPTFTNQIQVKIQEIDKNIALINAQALEQLTNPQNPGIKVLGNDVSFDYDPTGFNSQNSNQVKGNSTARKELRKKLAFLTRRLAWKTRANEDVNLLIIDDAYDKDYDIQAFEKVLGDLSLFKSTYTTANEQIRAVAEKLNLEVFANTQGHIEIRNPKYNRTPSSVFYRMMRTKGETGVQIFPQFLEDLFSNQVDGLLDQIGLVETQIRLYCLALGAIDDSSCEDLINTNNSIGGFSGNSGFHFVSDSTGQISQSQNIITLQSNPDQLAQTIQTKLDQISSQQSIAAFGIVNRSAILQSAATSSTINNIQLVSLQQLQSQSSEQTRQTNLLNILQAKGQQFDFNALFGGTVNSTQNKVLTNVDILRITNQIAQLLSDRQQTIKMAANALRNLKEGVSLDTATGGNQVLFPNLFGQNSTPQVFDHMIEDESYDDLGTNSGSRYVIKNRDILSFTLREVRPTRTSIEVTGRFGNLNFDTSALPSDLNVFQNGNALTTAAAVDYDLWRMYGITLPQPIDAPYLQDPQSQLAPYAVSRLNQSRKEIFQGTISIVGNEFQQPGEVVYIEEEDFLYYVETVSHDFTYGSNFTTNLNLTFGHNAGEYIPTPLDVVGKILYKNNLKTTSIDNRRQGSAFNQEHLGAFAVNTSASSTSFNLSSSDDFSSGPFGSINTATLRQIISQAQNVFAIQSSVSNPILELRVYYTSLSDEFSAPNPITSSLIPQIKQQLLGQNTTTPLVASTNSNDSGLSIFANQIVPRPVNMFATNEFRYPSAKAFHLARKIVQGNSSLDNQSSLSQAQIDEALYNCIIDAWIVYQNPNSNPSSS